MPTCARCAAPADIATRALAPEAKEEALCRCCAGKLVAALDVDWLARIAELQRQLYALQDAARINAQTQAQISAEIAALKSAGKAIPAALRQPPA
jgi:hypothetical protein